MNSGIIGAIILWYPEARRYLKWLVWYLGIHAALFNKASTTVLSYTSVEKKNDMDK